MTPSDPVEKPQPQPAALQQPLAQDSLVALPPSDVDKSQKSKRFSRPKRIIIIALALLIGALGLIITSGFIWYKKNLQPVSSAETSYQVIKIEEGQSVREVGEILKNHEIIANERAFELYMRFEDRGHIQAGAYRLASHQSVKAIVDMITSGEVSMLNIMIPPGQRLDQIKQILIKAGYDEIEIDDALSKIASHSLTKNLPKNTLLEGYLFPDTYSVAPDTSAEDLLKYIFDHFQEQITTDIKNNLEKQKITLKDAIILASIVQQEVPDYETQRKVAQVFIKRLKEGVPLGADPTFKYAAVMTDVVASPSLDSPYNTRIYSGLPPTAISNFNISALKAVANPSSTKYNYFVAGDDGRTHFTHTEDEHIAATKKYCTTLCE